MLFGYADCKAYIDRMLFGYADCKGYRQWVTAISCRINKIGSLPSLCIGGNHGIVLESVIKPT